LSPRPRQLADGAVAVDAAGRFVQLGQLNADIADASGIESGVDDPGRNTGIRPLFAYHTFEVDQPGDAVGARIENVTVVRELGVVVGHAAELNVIFGEYSDHREQPRSRVVFAMINRRCAVACAMSQPAFSARRFPKRIMVASGLPSHRPQKMHNPTAGQRKLIMKDAT